MSCSRFASLPFCLLAVLPIVLCHAAEPQRHGQPPRWSQDELDVFFTDARKQLVGSRPQQGAEARREGTSAEPPGGQAPASDAARAWSEFIEAETLITEIKRIHNQLVTTLSSAASFQGGGNLLCQRDFGLLAVLFGMVAEYDVADFHQDDRWQRSARGLQVRCFQTGQNCLAASDPSFTSAKEMVAVIGELIRGQVSAGDRPDGQTDEPPLVNRTQLMQSMELALKERLSPAIASAREFRKRAQLASEQAQLLAALAQVVQQEGYEYTDDDTYMDEARQLGQAAELLAAACREKNYEVARAALGRVGQSCSRCHEGYRG